MDFMARREDLICERVFRSRCRIAKAHEFFRKARIFTGKMRSPALLFGDAEWKDGPWHRRLFRQLSKGIEMQREQIGKEYATAFG